MPIFLSLNSYLNYHTINQLQPLYLPELRAFSLTIPLYVLQSVMPSLMQWPWRRADSFVLFVHFWVGRKIDRNVAFGNVLDSY